MKRSIFTISVLSRISVRRYFRDKTAIFFTVAFPLIFLFIFGGLFSKDNNVSFNIALINQSNSQFSKSFVEQSKSNKLFKIKNNINTLEEAQQKMSRSEIDAVVILPPDFGQIKNEQHPSGQAIIYYNQNNQQAAQTLGSVFEGIFTGINEQFIKYVPPFTVKTQESNVKGVTRFDYTFAGLVGFAIIGLGIFGPVNVFPELKKQGVLRRIHGTPLKVWQYFVSNVLSQATIGLFSIAIMFAVAVTFFHLRMHGNYFSLIFIIVFGILTIFGIGLAVGGWAKNERQAAPLANIIVFPMIFLSGTFFPRFLMPEWLQKLSTFLPLTPIIDSIRMIITENKTLIDLGPQLALLAVWTIIIYAIAFRVFRWE